MSSLTDFALREEYKRLESFGDKLSEIESLIDWEPFRPMIDEMYNNKTELVEDQTMMQSLCSK